MQFQESYKPKFGCRFIRTETQDGLEHSVQQPEQSTLQPKGLACSTSPADAVQGKSGEFSSREIRVQTDSMSRLRIAKKSLHTAISHGAIIPQTVHNSSPQSVFCAVCTEVESYGVIVKLSFSIRNPHVTSLSFVCLFSKNMENQFTSELGSTLAT